MEYRLIQLYHVLQLSLRISPALLGPVKENQSILLCSRQQMPSEIHPTILGA